MTLVSRVTYSDVQFLKCGFLLNFGFLSTKVKYNPPPFTALTNVRERSQLLT